MVLKNIERLLSKKLGPAKKITNVEITQPPQKGVGSLILKVKLTVLDEYNQEKKIHLITKKIPQCEYTQKMLKIQVTYKKEVRFYKDILPALREFEKEQGVVEVMDFFPEYYGARFNLEGKIDVNNDAELLLEDLSVQGVYYWCY